MPVATPRPAATVVIIDETGHVLLVQRHREIKFFGGAYSFPGGRVEPSDVTDAVGADCWTSDPAGLDFCSDRARLWAAYEMAARREVKEESGLTLDGPLLPWARWITPPEEPKRYDTLFFIARVRRGQVRVDGSETVAHRWLKPEDAIALSKTGEIVLPPPTYVTLRELMAYADYDAVVATHGVPTIEPVAEPQGDAFALVLPPIARGWPVGMPTRGTLTLTEGGVRTKFGE